MAIEDEVTPQTKVLLGLQSGNLKVETMISIGHLAQTIRWDLMPSEVELLVKLLTDGNGSGEPEDSEDESDGEPESGEPEEGNSEPEGGDEVICRHCEEVIELDGGYWRSVDRDDFYCKHSEPPQYHEPYNGEPEGEPEPSEEGEPGDDGDDASGDASDDYDGYGDYEDDYEPYGDDDSAEEAEAADGEAEAIPGGGSATPPPRVQEEYPDDIVRALRALGLDPEQVKSGS